MIRPGMDVRVKGRPSVGHVTAITLDQVWVRWHPAFVEVWDMDRLEPARKDDMRLIDLSTGRTLNIGDTVTEVMFGKTGTITSLHPPTHEGSLGIVGVQIEGRGYCLPHQPQEINAKFTDGTEAV